MATKNGYLGPTDSSYFIQSISAQNGTLTKNSNTSYTFTMNTPAQDATIDVTFGKGNEPIEVTQYAIITAAVGKTYYG